MLALLTVTLTLAHTLGAQTRDTTFAVRRNGVIYVNASLGSLVITGVDREVAELRSRGATMEIRSEGVAVTLASTTRNVLSRGTGYTSRNRERPEFALDVPRDARVVVNGRSLDVSVSGLREALTVQVQSGDIALRALRGPVRVEALAGDVDARDLRGDVRVTTTSGDVVARDVQGSVDIHSTSGDVELTGRALTSVRVEVTSGDLVIDGDFTDNADVSLLTHSGDVALTVPSSFGAQLEVRTANGRFSATSLTLLPGDRAVSGSTRRFQLGRGGAARLVIQTFSGDATVKTRDVRPDLFDVR
jgi:DUF4097 and DUF4098 domain-containing protein YvlB